MKKVLGLDLGSGSIGWAYIDRSSEKPIKAGVRVIPLKQNEQEEFKKGNAISTNEGRRTKRGARRNLDRYQLRRKRLIRLMIKEKWILNKEAVLQPLGTYDLWKLRSKAASEPIQLSDLARVLLHINKKRGFKSNRKEVSDEKELTAYKQSISDNDRMVRELGYTIGQWYMEQIQEHVPNRETPRFRNRVFSRKLHRDEFDRIWTAQSEAHHLTDELRKEIGDYTIFYQRPLKSQKGLLSRCIFYPKTPVIAESHPLFQLFRAWHDVNNLVLTRKSTRESGLIDLQTKRAIVSELSASQSLNKNGRLTKASIAKIISRETDIPAKDIDLNLDSIKGCTTLAEFQRLKVEHGLNLDLHFDPYKKGNEFDKQEVLVLWHMLYSIPSEDDLLDSLQNRFDLTREVARKWAEVSFSDSYGQLSARAIRRILPHMEDGHDYATSCEKAGLNHSNYLTKEENDKRELHDRLDLLKKNSLRNPVVEKVLNQMIHVVNGILSDPEMGRPDEIHIELSRDLTASISQRSQIFTRNQNRKKNHDRIREELKKFGLKRITRKDIEKFKLGEECNWISIYTGKPIQPSDVFTTNMYDIEHIIPRSRLFDDSYQNKTLCEREVNEAKGAQTAYDFIQTLGQSQLEAYVERVENLLSSKPGKPTATQVGWIYKSKHEKLLMPSSKIPDNFIDRQIRETQYISRKAMEILTPITREVIATSGTITAEMRKNWQLEEVLKEITLPHYAATGQVEEYLDKNGIKRIRPVGWSKRTDHRHHAVDAIVTALTTRAVIKRLNDLNKILGESENLGNSELYKHEKASRKFDSPMPNLRNEVKECLEGIIVSRKQGEKVATWSTNKIRINGRSNVPQKPHLIPRGELHKETVYGKRLIKSSEPVPLGKIDNPDLIISQQIRDAFIDRVSSFKGDVKKAFSKSSIKKAPFVIDGEVCESAYIWKVRYVTRKVVDENLKLNNVVNPQIREVLNKRLKEYGTPKKAFTDLENNPIWLDKEAGKSIKKVTVFGRATELTALRSNVDGLPKDFVDPQNNHHIAVYQKEDGKYHMEAVTLMEAVHRKQASSPIVDRNHADGYRFIVAFESDKYYYFGERGRDISVAELDPRSVFRMQSGSISSPISPDIYFRHQYEATLDGKHGLAMVRAKSIGRFPSHEIRVDHLGRIQSLSTIPYEAT